MSNRPLVSIIIPCYNHGQYLTDALESLSHCDQNLFETIIINDGSTDAYTNEYTLKLKNSDYHVVFQENKGLSASRNAGIAISKGEYILLLDADNKIYPSYITEAIAAFQQDPDIAVVYADANYFGDLTGHWKVGDFNLQRLMLYNCIDACAVVRKSAFDKLGGYDTNMKIGWEDWELWLRFAFAGMKFYYIEKPLYEYRVLKKSMSKTLYKKYQNSNSIENYIHSKYPNQMGHQWITELYARRFRKAPFLFLIKLILRAYFKKYYDRLLNQNKIRNGL